MFIELIGDNGVKEVSLADNKIRYMVDHLIREHFILSITTKNNKKNFKLDFIKIYAQIYQIYCIVLECVDVWLCILMSSHKTKEHTF